MSGFAEDCILLRKMVGLSRFECLTLGEPIASAGNFQAKSETSNIPAKVRAARPVGVVD